MNNPPTGYLGQVNASYQNGPPAPVSSQMPANYTPPPATVPYGSQPPLTAAQMFPSAHDTAITALGGDPSATPRPGQELIDAFQKGASDAMPPPRPMAPAPPPPQVGQGPALPPQADPMAFPLMRAGGGGVANVAAKETEMRGPTLQKAQVERNAALQGAAQTVAERQNGVAAFEFANALDQENRANARQDAAQYSAAARADELRERQQDFDDSVKSLSQMSVDPDRFWASRSTAQKIAGFVAVSLGGLLTGRGMRNPGLDMMNQAIDRDIDAQKFAFQAQRDTAQAKQTAFGMAMQKYQNVDAATAMARAASIDALQAQIAQAAALQHGSDAANRADAMLAQLQDDKMQQIAQGIAFSPARQVAVGATYVDPTTGLKYTEAQAHDLAKEYRGYGAKIGEINATGSQQLFLKAIEAEGKRGEKADERAKYISQAEQQAKIPEREAQNKNARERLRDNPLSTGERVDNAIGLSFQSAPTVYKWIHGKGAAEREQAWSGVVAEARHDLAGANVTPEEAKPIAAALEGAHDTESRMAALRLVDDKIAAQKANIRAGTDDSGESYDRNKRAVPNSAKAPAGLGAIPSFKPAGR